jgi:hypothetical protein
VATKTPSTKNNRCYCTLPPPTQRHLEKLAQLGTHGTDRSSVMTFLIMQGIQAAIEKGYIDPKEGD